MKKLKYLFCKRKTQRYKPVILVTGASTGIGLSIAKTLIAQGKYRVALTARYTSLNRFANEGICETDTVMLLELDVKVGEQRKGDSRHSETLGRGGHLGE